MLVPTGDALVRLDAGEVVLDRLAVRLARPGAAVRVAGVSPSISVPSMSGTSSGDGR